MDKETKIVLMVLVAFVAVWLTPLVAIWAVNNLFGLAIAYSLKNWFCALLLIGVSRR